MPFDEVYLNYAVADLSDIEQACVLDLANGYKQGAIANRHGYSKDGIQFVFRRLRERFHAESNTQLVAKLAITGVLL